MLFVTANSLLFGLLMAHDAKADDVTSQTQLWPSFSDDDYDGWVLSHCTATKENDDDMIGYTISSTLGTGQTVTDSGKRAWTMVCPEYYQEVACSELDGYDQFWVVGNYVDDPASMNFAKSLAAPKKNDSGGSCGTLLPPNGGKYTVDYTNSGGTGYALYSERANGTLTSFGIVGYYQGLGVYQLGSRLGDFKSPTGKNYLENQYGLPSDYPSTGNVGRVPSPNVCLYVPKADQDAMNGYEDTSPWYTVGALTPINELSEVAALNNKSNRCQVPTKFYDGSTVDSRNAWRKLVIVSSKCQDTYDFNKDAETSYQYEACLWGAGYKLEPASGQSFNDSFNAIKNGLLGLPTTQTKNPVKFDRVDYKTGKTETVQAYVVSGSQTIDNDTCYKNDVPWLNVPRGGYTPPPVWGSTLRESLNPSSLENSLQEAATGTSTVSYQVSQTAIDLINACGAGKDAASGVTTAQINKVDVSGNDSGTASTCAIDGIGWIICPVVTALSNAADGMYGILEGFLNIQPTMFNSDSAAHKAYNQFLPLANIVLAILFLVMIYAAAVGGGVGGGSESKSLLSNYNVKKILPRLLVFAVLMNISWYICAAAVDLSNILGSSLRGMFDSIAQSSGIAPQTNWSTGNASFSFATIAGYLLAGTAIIAGVVLFAGAGILLTIVLAVIVALLMMLLILIVRQAGVVILVVIAPLAFAMAMLPNTKKVFDKWWKAFYSLLLIYPMIGLVFGASMLAGVIITGQSNSGPGSSFQDFLLQIAGAACSVLPLFAVPFVLKGSLKGLGAIGNAIGGFAGGRMGAAGNRVKKNAQERYQGSIGRGLGNQAINWAKDRKGPVGYIARGSGRRAARGKLAEARKATMGSKTAMLGESGGFLAEQMALESEQKGIEEEATLKAAAEVVRRNPSDARAAAQYSQLKEQAVGNRQQFVTAHWVKDVNGNKHYLRNSELNEILDNGGLLGKDKNGNDRTVLGVDGKTVAAFGNDTDRKYGGMDELTMRAMEKQLAEHGSENEVDDATIRTYNLQSRLQDTALASAAQDISGAVGEYIVQSPKKSFAVGGKRVAEMKAGAGDGTGAYMTKEDMLASAIGDGVKVNDTIGMGHSYLQNAADNVNNLRAKIVAAPGGSFGGHTADELKAQAKTFVDALRSDPTKMSTQTSTVGGKNYVEAMEKLAGY